jgi:opacity protein-like surface antigen
VHLAILAAALAAPALARAEPPPSPLPGRVSFQLGLGPASQGAPVVTVGGGLALWEDGRTRIDLLGLAGFASSEEVKVAGMYGNAGKGDVQSVSVMAEVAIARRAGRLEPWVSAGLGTASVDGKFDVTCDATLPACGSIVGQEMRDLHESGTWVGGPTFAAGLRVALFRQLLVGAEVRYQYEGTSRVEELSTSAHVGGVSGLASIIWRVGGPIFRLPGAPAVAASPVVPPRRAEPSPPPAPPPQGAPTPEAAPTPRSEAAPSLAPAMEGCPSGQPPVFQVYPQRRFRCFPDPVRGGFFCEASALEAELSERLDCERGCRSGGDACPAGGASGAACGRCVAGCPQGRPVACTAGNAGSPEGEGCRLAAGAWGAPDSRVVPATCAAPTPVE